MTTAPIALDVTPPSDASARFATAAAWWDALGRVPLERIVFDPLPGTATVEDVVRLDDHEDRLCELIEGTLVRKAVGFIESQIGMEIGRLLANFVKEHRLGWVTGEGGMVQLRPKRVRIPDVAFVSFERLPADRPPSDAAPEVAPDLAVEVLSKSNTRREMEIKLREYFEAGVRLVWLVDPPTRRVEVYHSPTAMTRLDAADTLTGGDVLPGL